MYLDIFTETPIPLPDPRTLSLTLTLTTDSKVASIYISPAMIPKESFLLAPIRKLYQVSCNPEGFFTYTLWYTSVILYQLSSYLFNSFLVHGVKTSLSITVNTKWLSAEVIFLNEDWPNSIVKFIHFYFSIIRNCFNFRMDVSWTF